MCCRRDAFGWMGFAFKNFLEALLSAFFRTRRRGAILENKRSLLRVIISQTRCVHLIKSTEHTERTQQRDLCILGVAVKQLGNEIVRERTWSKTNQ
jgi:hypothetical protein